MFDPLRNQAHETDRCALLLGPEESLSRGRLNHAVDRVARALLSPGKALVWCVGDHSLSTVLGYLGAMRAGHAAAFLPATGTAESVARIVHRYRPEFAVADDGTARHLVRLGYLPVEAGPCTLYARRKSGGDPVDDHTALLLATSGSTGSPKAVRISAGALAASTEAIVSALAIDPKARAAGTLPIRYAYGLSVLNTHLWAGGSYLLTEEHPAALRVWHAIRRSGVTSFAGVPTTYRSLGRAHAQLLAGSQIASMTQAGGRLADSLVLTWAERMAARGGGFHVMYGQTEATARISVLHPAELPAAVGSVGRALPGGEIWTEPVDGHPEGEICYRGPGVMSGYVEDREQLAVGGEPLEMLRTGDLGSVRGGLLHVSGRIKRIVKVLGYRVDLDDLERCVEPPEGQVVFVAAGDRIVMVVEAGWTGDREAVRRAVVELLGVPDATVAGRFLKAIPRTYNGKCDYAALSRAVQGSPAAQEQVFDAEGAQP
ncbi:AMP-binding protein [Streptomyces sp. NPDC019531]|uniref:AMP-binding protein n=1 Tax=Streptomyces sp. NPDC019531 TaxID=3365062 RepID=UPI00384A7731